MTALLTSASHLTVLISPAGAATPGTEAVQGLVSYFLTMPNGGIKLAVARLGAIAGGMGFISTGGDKMTAAKIWGLTLGRRARGLPSHPLCRPGLGRWCI